MTWKQGQTAYHPESRTLFKICAIAKDKLIADPNDASVALLATDCHIADRSHLKQATTFIHYGKKLHLQPTERGVIVSVGDRKVAIHLLQEPDEVDLAASMLAQTFNGAIVKGEIDLTQFGIEEEEDDADF